MTGMTMTEARRILDKVNRFFAAWNPDPEKSDEDEVRKWVADGVDAAKAGAPMPTECADAAPILTQPNGFWVGYMLQHLESKPYRGELIERAMKRPPAGNA